MGESTTSKSILSSSEFAFPRGGATALTPLEVKEISNEATKDVLFEQATAKRASSSSKPQPKRQKKSKSKSDKQDEEETENVETVEFFNFKNLIPGTLVLGQIIKIGKFDITLSLGDNLVGYVPITSISSLITKTIEELENDSESEDDEEEQEETTKEFPDLSTIFKLGSWLKAKVVAQKDEKKKRIEFTIETELVNELIESEDLIPGNLLQASVVSVEDHGIIVDIGKPNISGFISNKELTNGKVDVDSVKPGLVLLTTIVSQPKGGRTVTLKPATVTTKKPVAISTISSVDAIQPGMIVEALIGQVTSQGLIVKVFGLVDGSISLPHLREFNVDNLKHKHSIGSKVKARVLAVLLKSGVKKLILSVAQHVLQLEPQEVSALEAFPVGHKLEEVEVIGKDVNYIYVKLANFFGQIHNSKIDADKTLDIDYTIGTKHPSRVIGYNSVDDLLIMTFESSVIESEYLSASDIPSGTLIPSCEILKVLPESGGIQVKFFDQFEGLVPSNQMSDIKLVYPERKFRVGTKVKGRVIGQQGKTVLVTLRKALVNLEDDEILSKFEDAKVGFKTNAIVEKFVHNGAIVSFFGRLRAFLPKNEISETFVEQAQDHLKLGQIVQTRILDVNLESERLIVTLKQATGLSQAQKSTITDLTAGKSIVDSIVVEKTKNSILIELKENNLRGVIYDGQLIDGNYEQNRAAMNKLEIGSSLQVLILDKDLRARTVIATAKKSLIDAVKSDQFPTTFEEVSEGKLVKGYIKSVTNFGLFVSFAGKLTGLILAKYAGEKPEDLSKKFYKHQSVSCRVIRIDQENKRFLLSFNTGRDIDSEELINPIDKSKKSISDYAPGILTKAMIKSVKGTQLNVQLSDNLQGRVDITQCFNSWKEIKDKHQPLSQFHKGEILDVKVIGYHDAKNHKFLPISHRTYGKSPILELSITDVSETPFTDLKLSDVKPNDQHIGFVNNIHNGLVWVSVTPSVKGHVSFMHLTDDTSIFHDIDNKLPIGCALELKVDQIDNEHHVLVMSGKNTHGVKKFKDVEIGKKYPVRIIKVKDAYVLVEIGPNIIASAYITDALNDYSDKLEQVFHPNDYVIGTVVDIDHDTEKVAVSLRSEDEEAGDKTINSIEDLTRGDIVKGFVKNVANNGVYVALGRSVYALVRVSDLSDSYLKDWKKFFKPNQLVVGKISACKEEGRVLMTLKESEVSGELNYLKKFEDLEVGDIFEGSIKRVTDFGVFVKLDGTVNVSGLCHQSEIAETKVENIAGLFGEGDRVKVKILKINQEKKQLSLGMKASYFTDANEEEAQEEDIEMEDSENEVEEEENSEDEVMDIDEEESAEEASSDEEEEDDDDDSESKHSDGLGLSTNGFDWTASILDQAEDESSDEEDEDFTQEKKKKRKTKQTVEDKTGDLNTRAPQSVGDFERLLIGNPNSSIMWMNYMSFQLQLSEIDKAREIGERALKTINYREEQEKMNIWIALLNLENTFGSDESLEATFKRACQYMDSLIMHQKLVSIYTMSEKYDQADELYKVMTKKFGKNIATWVHYGSYLLDRELQDKTHEILAKALQVLPKRDHIEVVRKFAQLEFVKGDPEQGRSLFEGLISDAPKRIDLWNVYIDQEIKQDDSKEKIEDLFERVVTKKLSRKQAKFFFKKWLEFEEGKGDEKMIGRVKSKASEYVQNANKD
ncbi:rRNA biogenesis protein RRP5 [Spathaspora sp. JA1]|nr:rRNA biogenesis protein RRP5 [Spathaspora sp. JA1]